MSFIPKDDVGRRAIGMPRIDTHEYRARNWLGDSLAFKYYEVTGEASALAAAERAARWAIANRSRPGGAVHPRCARSRRSVSGRCSGDESGVHCALSRDGRA